VRPPMLRCEAQGVVARMYIMLYIKMVAKVYSVAHARAHLPEILDDAEAGRDVHLSRRGRRVAVVLSSDRYDALTGDKTDFSTAYSSFVSRNKPTQIGLPEGFANSLRDHSPGRKIDL